VASAIKSQVTEIRGTWKAPGPSAPRKAIETLFIGKVCAQYWAFIGSRLQETAALQVNDGHRSLDRDLEGVRSLGAALIDGNFVYSGKYAPNIGPLLVPGCKGLQPSKSITAIEGFDRDPGPSAPPNPMR